MSATTLILLLLVLACPLSMLFMHRGSGHAHGSHCGSPQRAGDDHGEGHETHVASPREAAGDAGTDAGESGDAHDGCGHCGGSQHDDARSDVAA